MGERRYFDCNASFGPRMPKEIEERWTLDHLLADLDLAGIAGALVRHAQGTLYDPMMSNMTLVREIEAHRDRLFPCWVAMPALSGDFPPVQEFMDLADAHDVRAVWVDPNGLGLPVREVVWGELRDALLDRDLPVLTSVEDWGRDFDGIDRFLTIFRKNRTLLMNGYWSQWRWLVHLMNQYENLHIEFATFQSNRAIEYFAGRYGAGRCLFGTGLPNRAPGAARGFLDWTLLPGSDAANVAGGNLKRLLKGAGPTAVPPPGEWSDSLTEAARKGAPLPCLIVDDHCHVMHDGGCSAGKRILMHKGDADGMIELTRKVGIDKTAIMSWAGPLSGDPDTGNEIVANAVRQYPDELIGVVTIRPEIQGPAEIEATIQKYHVGMRMPGLKPFPRQTMDYDHPAFDPWFRFADEHHLYMVYDPATCFEAGTPIIEHLATKYPNLGLHLDHCGRSWRFARWAAEMVNRFPSVYAQLNYTLVTNGTIEYLAETCGADRLLFGTDSPMRDPRPQAGWLVFTRLREEDKRKVFGENFARILAECRV